MRKFIPNLIQIMTPLLCAWFIWNMQKHACEHGINGVALTSAVVLIAGLGGYSAKEAIALIRDTLSKK